MEPLVEGCVLRMGGQVALKEKSHRVSFTAESSLGVRRRRVWKERRGDGVKVRKKKNIYSDMRQMIVHI